MVILLVLLVNKAFYVEVLLRILYKKDHFPVLFVNKTFYKTRFVRTCDLTVSCLKLILLSMEL